MPIIRKQLKPADVYPDTIRYNSDTDQVESLVNGEWIDNPEADPRTQTTFPPRMTSNTDCDAGQSVADALKGQIDKILEAIDGAATVFTIAGLILGIFTFGVFGIFIGLALGIGDQMLTAGTTSLSAALTETAYHTLACILTCHMDGSGRLNAGDMAAVQADVTGQIGGLGATILNQLLSLAGEGGINNLASLGTSTGDCDDCACAWCYTFEFSEGALDWTPFAQSGANVTHLVTEGWQGGCNASSYFDTSVERTFTGTVNSLEFRGYLDIDTGAPDAGIMVNGSIVYSHTAPQFESIHHVDGLWSGSLHVQMFANAQCASITQIRAITIRGTGENPFGEDNC